MYKIISLLLLVSLASAQQFWSQCTHQANIATPHRVIASSCDHQRCRVVRGDVLEPTAYMFFNNAHEELRVRATAFILGIGVNLPVEPPFDDGCLDIVANGVRTGCPVFPNIEYTTTTSFTVPAFFPAFANTVVRIEYVDRGTPALCLQFIADLL